MLRFHLLILLVFTCVPVFGQETAPYAIVIHGGAGGDPDQWPEEYKQQRRDGLSAALDRGVELLKAGTDALDVVEQVVRSMEDDATFNAGRGCVLNENGEHELDASIMDGRTLDCGAVASVRKTKNPITLARKVMTETRHILLMGSGADQFGAAHGIEQADAAYFQTDRQRAKWEMWKSMQSAVSRNALKPADSHEEIYLGTVGCVVLDTQGNLAAATSTGGLMGKSWGRVGDSPIIGAGNYADNQTCAVSGTGVGEEFIRHQVGSDIAAQMRYTDRGLAKAAKHTIGKLPPNCGGVIAVDGRGHMVMEFNTLGMSRAYANSEGERGIQLARED